MNVVLAASAGVVERRRRRAQQGVGWCEWWCAQGRLVRACGGARANEALTVMASALASRAITRLCLLY